MLACEFERVCECYDPVPANDADMPVNTTKLTEYLYMFNFCC